MNEIIDEINLLSTAFWLYFKTKIPFGYMIFFSWFEINEYRICILNILIPHVVEPAHPPINISPINKTNGKLPQLSNCALTYPVPVKIDITLNITDLKFNWVVSFKIKYIERIITLEKIIFKKVLIWISEKKIFLFPFKNLI